MIEWGDPLYAAGHWVPEMVRRAGGVDVLARAGEHSVIVELAAVRAADPEVILVAPCGYDLDASAAEGERLLASDEWARSPRSLPCHCCWPLAAAAVTAAARRPAHRPPR